MNWRFSILHAQMFICVAVVVGPFFWLSNNNLFTEKSRLRQLAQDRTSLARSVGVLQDLSSVVATVNEHAPSLESLTLALIEAVESESDELGLRLHHLSVQPNTGSSSSEVQQALRVQFSVELRLAMELLPLLDAVKSAADWRPTDIRRCSLSRNNADNLGLNAECAIDVPIFRGLDL